MDALKQASVPSLQAIYSTTVWNGNNTWPNSMDPFSNVDEIPPRNTHTHLAFFSPNIKSHSLCLFFFSPVHARVAIGFTKTPVRINVPLEMRTTKWESNPKYLAMAEHITQNGVQCSFLLRFLHRDEMFWTKSPTEDKRVPIADAGSDVEACQGEVVTLDGTRSVLDPSDAEIKWVQTKGPSVAIEGDTTLTPHFAVPKLQNQEGSGADLEFELTVTSYGGVKAFPSSVVVVS